MDLLQNYTNKAEGLREENAYRTIIRPKADDAQASGTDNHSELK